MGNGNPFPNIPDVAGVYGAPAAPKTNPLAGAGAGGSKTRDMAMVTAALQGIRSGYQQSQLREYDTLQNSYLQARTSYDLFSEKVKAASQPGSGIGPEELKAYTDNMKAAYTKMGNISSEIIKKYGSKSGKGKGGQQDGMQKFGEVLHDIFLGKRINVGDLQQYKLPGQGQKPATPGTPPTFPNQTQGQDVPTAPYTD